MGVKEVAKKQIIKMEHIVTQINEAEDLLISLKTPALKKSNELMTDISIGVPTQFSGRGFFQEEQSRWHTVRLEEDLGVTDIQEEIRKLVAESVQKRIDVLKSELRKTIYHVGGYHE